VKLPERKYYALQTQIQQLQQKFINENIIKSLNINEHYEDKILSFTLDDLRNF
jgi:hypothetical protein